MSLSLRSWGIGSCSVGGADPFSALAEVAPLILSEQCPSEGLIECLPLQLTC